MSDQEALGRWAQLYAAACQEVFGSANACLEVANRAVGARRMIAQHQNDGLPGTPIAIRNFTSMAEKSEQEFVPLYRAFDEACAHARETAANFIGAAETKDEAEVRLGMSVEEAVLDNVATAKAILSSNYGSTPYAFIEGLEQTNAIIQGPPQDGNIYTPLAPSASDQRACPWCAETIKAAAVICRFCGRDVNVQPNVAPSS
jgi:hypothetical protein